MRNFSFNIPHENVETKYHTSIQHYDNVNTGRFLRNCVIDSKTYNNNDLVPAYIKTADLVPCQLASTYSSVEYQANTCYGLVQSSDDSAYSILSADNYGSWIPEDNGINSWISVKLPEADICESYLIRTASNKAPLSWKLQGSNDNSNWQDIDIREDYEWNEIEKAVFTVQDVSRNSYIWYKLVIIGSNTTSIELTNLRLFRPQSICPVGKMYIDANPAFPLVLSFANGYNADGSSLDEAVSISSREIIDLGVIKNKWTDMGLVDNLDFDFSELTPISIYAAKNDTGSIDIEYEIGNNTGNSLIPTTDSAKYGFTPNLLSNESGNYLPSGSVFKAVAKDSFYVSAISSRAENENKLYSLKITLHDNSEIVYNSSVSIKTIYINNYIKKIEVIGNDAYDFNVYGYAATITRKYQNGKVFESTDGTNWKAVKKIYLGSVTVLNNEIKSVRLNSNLVTSTGYCNQCTAL